MNLDFVGLISSGSVSISIPKSKKLSVSTLFSLMISKVALLVESTDEPIATFEVDVIPVSAKFLRPVGCRRPLTVEDNWS